MSTIPSFFISVTDLRARFSYACEQAENGRQVIITKHGFPYMQLVPLTASDTALHQKPAKPGEAATTA